MDLYNTIKESYPEIDDFVFGMNGSIELRDDGDGIAYIAKWDYVQPIPQGLKLGK